MQLPTQLPDPTPAQREAITRTDGGLLVSAAAGSGKTATLARRVAHLVCAENIPLEQILVVTFTENAAAEMRQRIEHVLRIEAAKCGSTHARRQVLLAGRAQVGTIHSFCSRLIRQHFQRLGLEPRFAILPAAETPIIQQEVVRAVLDAAYQGPEPQAFQNLVRWYADDNDERIADLVLALHARLGAVVDPAAWRKRALQRLEDGADDPRTSELGKAFESATRLRVRELALACEALAQYCDSRRPEYAGFVRQLLAPSVASWDAAIERGEVWELAPYEAPSGKGSKLPMVKGGSEGLPEKKAMDNLRADLKLGPYPNGLPADFAFWREALGSTVPHMRELLRLGEVFEAAYTQAKEARRCLDFNDLERHALRLLRNADGTPTDVARGLHQTLRHVLVDECQDVNAVQNAILSLVSTECLDETGAGSNLFSVGDIKQSIYRFRLAEPALFQNRGKAYGSRGIIRLEQNFRSRAPLLAAVNRIFARVMTGGQTEIDYRQGHDLQPGRAFPTASFAGAPFELHLIPKVMGGLGAGTSTTASEADEASADSSSAEAGTGGSLEEFNALEREAQFVAHRIAQLRLVSTVVGDDGKPRSVRYGDIAILLRTAEVKAKQLAAILRRHGVPVFADARGGLLEAQEVQDVLALLELIDNPARDLALVTYLRGPLARLDGVDQILAEARADLPGRPFHEAVWAYAKKEVEPGRKSASSAALHGALGVIDYWRRHAQRRPIGLLLEEILERTRFPVFVAGLADGPQRLANLNELLDHARVFAADGGRDLHAFLAFLKELQDGKDLSLPTVTAEGSDGVRVLTVHKAKGLEYPIVFVLDLAKGFNEQELREKVLIGGDDFYLAPVAVDESKLALYPSPAWVLARETLQTRLVAEELRALYVALTRAREHIILVGTVKPAVIEKISGMAQSYPEALPEAQVLGAKSALEWLIAAHASAVAATSFGGGGGGGVLEIVEHTEDDVTSWTEAATAGRVAMNERVVEGLPLGVAITDPVALAVIGRVNESYPHPMALERPAAISVTTLTKGGFVPPRRRSDEEEPTENEHVVPDPLVAATAEEEDVVPTSGAVPPDAKERDKLFPLPRLRRFAAELGATDRGTATHVAIEHFDFAGSTDPASIAAAIQKLVQRNILTVREAAVVDPGAIAWLAASELGALLRGERGILHRELPIYLPNNRDPEVQGLDRQMIRGRIDLMVDTADGPIIIDYKTDDVWGERLAGRIALYAGQVRLYREAAEAITGRRCAGVYLAFVATRARRIVSL